MDNQKYKEILDNVSKVIVGKEDVITYCLVAMVAGGHILLEDVPGTGKTVLAKSIARSMDMEFSRIQFTPDLLPGDITGLNVWHAQNSEFEFIKGPVFTNILLADEINRATPRTQAGLLECMQENQVTVDSVTRPLPDPFFVIATQNPVETSGTFPLPEAQLDRFLMKLSMGFPDKEEEENILRRFMHNDVLKDLDSVAGGRDILNLRTQAVMVKVSDSIISYITDIAAQSRVRNDVASGISPRGALALMNTARVLALFRGRDYVVPEDVKELAVPVLAHRLIMPHRFGDENHAQRAIEEILQTVNVPTEEFQG
ncbi:MAG: MoxR family ATPase [Lachnospiraceae bacterium]|nr:MoxR family ATPase [Lachnospiraceae bacterium]